MVIRRIRDHVAAHNWFAVAVDLGIVVAGVFLGAQANNWNEARIERAAVAEYRLQIIDDLKDNETDLLARKIYYATVREHALAALAAIESPTRPGGEPFLIDAYQASQVWLRPLVRTGYDEMIGAGLTQGIGDSKVRSRLITYYTQSRQFDINALNTTTYRERLRRALPYAAQAAIRQSCGEKVTILPSGSQVFRLPASCAPGLSEPLIALAVARVQAADLGQDLTRHIADLDQKLAGFERIGQLAHDHRLYLQARNP